MALGLLILVQHRNRYADVDHDLQGVQFSLESCSQETTGAWCRSFSLVGFVLPASTTCRLVWWRKIRYSLSWVNPESTTLEVSTIISVEDDVLHQKKSGYLNTYFFSLRLICYFAIFCGLSHWLRKVSFSQDKDGSPEWTILGSKISAAGIPAAALALTFGAFDLFMSLEYQWFSTMYGVWFLPQG